MFELLYTSTAKQAFSSEQIFDLLQSARVNNKLLRITGLLLCHEKYIMQLLEGDEQIVKKLYYTISTDKRHKQVELFHVSHIPKRSFSGWSMAFRSLNHENIRFYLPGHTSLHRDALPQDCNYLQNSPNKQSFLTAFKTICQTGYCQQSNYVIH